MVIYKQITDKVYEINLLDASSKDLEEITTNRSLGLSVDEMQQIKSYFKKLKRNPTDIELESIAQAWSEHCCYKTSKLFLKNSIFNIKNKRCINVIKEDAGVVEFNKDYAYVVALESHNHPSALDPYGGAATGIGGILRDVVCMGAQPIALVDPLYFGSLDFDDKKLPKGTKHPRYLFRGVVKGIGDYGNKVGIPTIAGQCYFHDSYTANCLVNVGCIGIVKKSEIIHSKAGNCGDLFILAGGRTGLDGIHGVTFASAELTEASEEASRPAVQLGDPITKEPLIHACLEINKRGLATGMKDLGGGGLSCVVGEMSYSAGFGARIQLEKVPLKVANIAPWEIWVSESQERMMLTCRSKNLKDIMDIFALWDVEAVVIGEVTDTKKLEIYWHGKLIYNLDLEFITGAITCKRPYLVKKKKLKAEGFKEPTNLNKILLKLLSSQNICSREWIIRQYDHEVRANSVIKPMQGVLFMEGPGDAALIKPLQDSWKGLAIAADVNPYYTELDSYWGTASAVEECIRNLVAVGAKPDSFADNPNFGNPEKEHNLGDFKQACDAMYWVANYFKIPFVSGNVSFYNESESGPVAPTPTILGIGIIDDVRKAITIDFKQPGNPIYVIGKTFKELGGSEYCRLFNETGQKVPRVNLNLLKNKINAILSANEFIESCHDISNGGLLIAVAEMCIAGNLGAEIDITKIPAEGMRNDFILFSESNGRWIVEVNNKKKFERIMKRYNVEFACIGEVTRRELRVEGVRLNVDKMRKAFNTTLPRFMGEY